MNSKSSCDDPLKITGHTVLGYTAPLITVAFAAGMVVVFAVVKGYGEEGWRIIYGLGLTPAVVAEGWQLPAHFALVPPVATFLTALFVHGSISHLLINLVFLCLIGPTLEKVIGPVRFVIFFLVCGVFGGIIEVTADPEVTIPVIGASGSVSGLLGAFMMLFPMVDLGAKYIGFPWKFPAIMAISAWAAFQAVGAAMTLSGHTNFYIAWWAHLGGFAAGLILIILLIPQGWPLLPGLFQKRATSSVQRGKRTL